MLERIKHMLIKEFIQIFRDPRMKGVIFLMPIIQALVFGYAVTTDVKHIRTAVYDLDNRKLSWVSRGTSAVRSISLEKTDFTNTGKKTRGIPFDEVF